MTQAEVIQMLKSEKEIIALNRKAHMIFLAVGLNLLSHGVSVATIVKGYKDDEKC